MWFDKTLSGDFHHHPSKKHKVKYKKKENLVTASKREKSRKILAFLSNVCITVSFNLEPARAKETGILCLIPVAPLLQNEHQIR